MIRRLRIWWLTRKYKNNLGWGDPGPALRIVEKWGKLAAFDQLILALEHVQDRVRKCAVEQLSMLQDPRAVEPLVHSLRDYAVRDEAAEALVRIGDVRAVMPLCGLLGKVDGVGKILGRLGDARALNPLFELLTSRKDRKNFDVREDAMAGLQRLDCRPILNQLLKMLDSTDSSGIFHARRLLEKIDDPNVVEPLLKSYCEGEKPYSLPVEISHLCDRYPDEASDALLRFMDSPDSKVRKHGTYYLGEIKGSAAVESLLRALTGNDVELAGCAANALGRIGDPRAIDPLISILRELTVNDVELARCAANALGRIGDPRAIDPLISILRDPHLRANAVSALVEISGERALRSLIPMLSSDDRRISDEAGKALIASTYPWALMPCLEWVCKNKIPPPQDLADVKPGKYVLDVPWWGGWLNDHFKSLREMAMAAAKTGDLSAWPLLLDHICTRPEWSEAFVGVGLFGKYDEPVREIFGIPYPIEEEETDHGREGTVSRSKYPSRLPTSAIEKLLSDHSRIASSLLHLIARRTNVAVITVSGGEHCANVYQVFSAEEQRALAREELARRGQPAFEPAVFQEVAEWNPATLRTKSDAKGVASP